MSTPARRVRKTKNERKDRVKDVRKALAAAHVNHRSVQELRNERARTRMDSGTQSALSYALGLVDPFGHGRKNVRLPSDGLMPTSVVNSFNRFAQPFAVVSGSSGVALGGLIVHPNLKYQYTTLASASYDGTGLGWASAVAGGAWSSVASNAVFYRGAVNLGVRLHFSGAAMKRGGTIYVGILPPGYADGSGALPTSTAQLYAAPSTSVYDVAKLPDQLTLFWLPSAGEAPVLYTPGSVYPTASTWINTSSVVQTLGDSALYIIWRTADDTGTDMTCHVEIVNNTEFIAGYGGANQLFPGRVAAGGAADVSKVMKPLEASYVPAAASQMTSSPASSIGSWLSDVAGSAMDVGKQALSFAANPQFMGSFMQAFAPAGVSPISNLGTLSKSLSQPTFEGAAGMLEEMIPFALMARHRAALALNLPERSPLNHYGLDTDGRPPVLRRNFRCPPLTDLQFESLLASDLRRRCAQLSAEQKMGDPPSEPDIEDSGWHALVRQEVTRAASPPPSVTSRYKDGLAERPAKR